MSNKALNEQQKVFHAHRQYHRLYFKANDMDFVFQWLMGSAVHGGAGIGESFHAAAGIRDGDPHSWELTWTALANRVQQRAAQALQAGHVVSGRDAYLRAAVYYRAVLASLLPDDPQFKATSAEMRTCFAAGGALLEQPVEKIEIPFEGRLLPGYFQRAAASGPPRPTLLMIGGAETFTEDLYFFIAPAAVRRGYNFATVDLPGQGLTPYDGLFFRRDTEVPLAHILDCLLSRPEVDPQRLAAYGISAGGYFVPRAAVHEPRIKACIANSMIWDFPALFRQSSTRKMHGLFLKLVSWRAPFGIRMARLMAWRFGAGTRNIPAMMELSRDFVFDPAQIPCPTLILIGEGEVQNPMIREQQEHAMAVMPHPGKKFILGPLADGAGSHCMGENLPLMSQFVFDWLDEVFKGSARAGQI